MFWRNEYSHQCKHKEIKCLHSWDKDAKRFIYNIRHLYGLEGGRTNYSAHTCASLQVNSNFIPILHIIIIIIIIIPLGYERILFHVYIYLQWYITLYFFNYKSALLAGWGICRLYSLQIGKSPPPALPKKGCLRYDTKLHLILRVHFWSFGVCRVLLHFHYSQVHSEW